MAQCEFCGRCFARNEHLIRHLRIHTGERPFLCPHCKAGFQRPDVLAKHVQKLHPQAVSTEDSGAQGPDDRPNRLRDRERSKLACDQCRRRKLKCNNVRPCDSCRSKLLTCTVSSSSRPPGRPRNTVTALPTERTITVGQPTTHHDNTIELHAEATIPRVLEPWTPDSLEPPTLGHTHRPALGMVQASNPDLRTGNEPYFGSIGLPLPVDGWMGSEPMNISTVPTLLAVNAIQLPQNCETINFLDDLVPSADFGNWLDDLDEFSSVDDILAQHPTNMGIDAEFNSSMESAVSIMEEQLRRRSRASSPSRETQQRSWYSTLPQLSAYDDDVVNVLLNVSKSHISSTFTIFADFEVDHETRVELCLAMAAVGGLYCTAPGNTKVAKMLFNDSRRLMLEGYLQHPGPSFEDSMIVAKTFILLEIYGLCSGDKRAYEFMEVFHGSKVHAARSCIDALPRKATMHQQKQAQLLIEAMLVLDSYRVLLMHRPPSFVGDPRPLSQPFHFHRLPTGGIVSILSASSGSETGNMHHLATIIRYSWAASPRDVDSSNLPALWKTEFVELALDGWLRSQTTKAELPGTSEATQLLLYHLTQVSIHSNMGILQRLAQLASQSASPTQRTEALSGSMQPWHNSRHSKIAVWHAKAILDIAQGMIPSQRLGRTTLDKTKTVEPPHLPLCIYFATLVLWFSDLGVGEKESSLGEDELIEAGSQSLFRLRVPVAKLLGMGLCELLTTESC